MPYRPGVLRAGVIPSIDASPTRPYYRAPARPGFGRVLCGRMTGIGAWRSLVAHLLWEQRVGGSNPSAPTKISAAAEYSIARRP